MPIPLYDPRMNWKNRIPPELIQQQDPYAQIANALTGGLQQYGQMQEQQKQQEQDALFRVLASGNLPAQSTQPVLPGQIADINKYISQTPGMVQKPITPTEQVTQPTPGFIPTPQLRGIQGIAPRQPVSSAFEFENLRQKNRVDLLTARERVKQQSIADMGNNPAISDLAKRVANYEIPWTEATAQFRTMGTDGIKMKEAMYNKIIAENPQFNTTEFNQAYNYDKNVATSRLNVSIGKVDKTIDKVIEISQDAKRTGMPIVNQYLAKYKPKFGNVAFSNWNIVNKVFADDLSIIFGQGYSTDLRLELGLDITDPSLNADQLIGAMETLKDLVNISRESMSEIGVAGLKKRQGLETTTQDKVKQDTGLDTNAILKELQKMKPGGK